MSTIPGKKIFVGSLPDGIQDATLRAAFEQFGQVEEIFIKQGCESGRQWAFVTFASQEQAVSAKESCDRVLQLPGSAKPCEVMYAKNQGMMGSNGGGMMGGMGQPMGAPAGQDGPRKIFVGGLPDGVMEHQIQAEFGKFGVITETYIKQGCESGRQWAFITFASAQEASLAKQSTDRIFVFPGSEKTCEVTFARNQGMFGQGNLNGGGVGGGPAPSPAVAAGPRKIFVGGLPDGVAPETLRESFGPYGTVVEVFVKPNAEPGRQWAFVTFATPQQAQLAKDSTDRVLVIPGGEAACQVMLARNQGQFGQDPVQQGGKGGGPVQGTDLNALAAALVGAAGLGGGGGGFGGGFPGGQPPPPNSPPPAHLQWQTYHTKEGQPYYYNILTRQTQWEMPPEMQVAQAMGAAARYSPY